MNRTRYIALASVFLNLVLLILLVFLVNRRSIDFSEVATNVEERLQTEDSSSQVSLTDVLGEADKKDISDKKEVLVTKVIDGDTIVIEGGEIVRYIGIDTPEMSQGNECFSQESTQKNKELVEGKLVRLEKDVSETDRYRRLLKYAWVSSESGQGDIFVNDYLVRQGYATAVSYPPDIKFQEQFREGERQAKEFNLGLWSLCSDSIKESPNPEQNKSTSQVTGDKDCSDFTTHSEAKEFFISQGGPASDPHKLDQDKDGNACESLP